MVDTPTTAIVAAGGAVIGAGFTAVASAFTARQKIRELDVAYKQRLQDGYLANARAYTHTLYIPLGITLTKLSEAYLALLPISQTTIRSHAIPNLRGSRPSARHTWVRWMNTSHAQQTRS